MRKAFLLKEILPILLALIFPLSFSFLCHPPTPTPISLPSTISTTVIPDKQKHKIKKKIKKNFDPHDGHFRITSLGRRGQTDAALQLYHHLFFSGQGNRLRLVNAVVDACSRATPPRLDTAFRLFNESRAWITPNVYTYGALTSCCARARDADRALLLLDECEPNAVVYGAVLNALGICGRMDEAKDLLMRVKRDKKVQVGSVHGNAVLSGMAKVGDWKGSVELLGEMERMRAVDSVSYSLVMSAFEKAEEWEEVMRYARESDGRWEMDGIGITSVLKACAALGLGEEALKRLTQFEHLKGRQRTTRGWERGGVKSELLRPDDVAFVLCISACGKAGMWKDAIKLLRRRPMAGAAVYTAVMKACAENQQFDACFHVWNEMQHREILPTVITYTVAISACATAVATNKDRVKNWERGWNFWQSIKDKDANVVNYNTMIKLCAGMGARELPRAFNLVHSMLDKGIQPTMVTFGTLVTACERANSIGGTKRAFRLFPELIPNEIVFGAAISCCRKTNDVEYAFQLFKQMMKSEETLRPNTALFNTLLISQTENHQLKRATQIFKLMLQSKHSKNITGKVVVPQADETTYAILIRAYNRIDKPEEARLLLNHYLVTNDYKEVDLPDVSLFTETIAVFEKKGQVFEAIELMETMRDYGFNFYQNEILNSIFKKLVAWAAKVSHVVKEEDPKDTRQRGEV